MSTAKNDDLVMFVLDVLRYDIEPLSSILNLINDTGCIGWRQFWPHDFREAEVTDALVELVDRGWVTPLRFDETDRHLSEAAEFTDVRTEVRSLWFKPTREGIATWDKWTPPKEAED